MKKLTKKQMDNLGNTLPSASLISAALAYELGKVGAEKIYADADTLNSSLDKVGKRMRDWLVNPPNGKYSCTAK